MGFDPQQHHRRSIRLQGYDYAQAGAYFVTVCTQDRECLFGEIVEGTMRLNDAGRMVQAVWDELPDHYPGVDVDAFVAMPNHVHGIIVLTGDPVGAPPRGCPDPVGSTGSSAGTGQARGPAPTDAAPDPRDCPGLPDAAHRFKSFTTAQYRHGVADSAWLPFPGRLWQRNYYEHIIRNEAELARIRQYIDDNPAQWDLDRENPAFQGGRT